MKQQTNLKSTKILAILAHPDDETLGFGGTLAYYADIGVETHLVCATRGQRGWPNTEETYPGPDELGSMREAELMQAAQILNLKSTHILDYMDGDLDQADPQIIIPELAAFIQQIQPQVVLTFDPYGVYGHPDHIAIAQFTTAAIIEAASNNNNHTPHRVDALYYRVTTQQEMDSYQAAFGDLSMKIDGVNRNVISWPEWSVSARIDTRKYVEQVWQAVNAHRSQLPTYEHLMSLSLDEQQAIFGTQTFYRAFSFTKGGREQDSDLLTPAED